MSNVETWVSAALVGENVVSIDFPAKPWMVGSIKARVTRVFDVSQG